ncbi:MAG: hypothetical protein CVV27_03095, partial [Candidatus Melainabacteria bacterium HGW-Melainabacteria-1]
MKKTLKQFICLPLLASVLLCGAAAPTSWQLNTTSTRYEPAILASTPQAPFVTLNVRNQPIDKVLAEIQKQTGQDIKWEGSKVPQVNLITRNAPLWAVIAQLCRQTKTGFSFYSQPGNPIKIAAPTANSTFSTKPVLAWQAQGPLLLSWNGRVRDTEFDFDQNPPKPIDINYLSLSLNVDRQSSVSLEVPTAKNISFTLANGKIVKVAPKELQDGAGGRVWRIPASKDLAGQQNVSLEMPLKVLMPTRTFSADLPWRADQAVRKFGQNFVISRINTTDSGIQATLRSKPQLPKGITESQIKALTAKSLKGELSKAERRLLDDLAQSDQAMVLDSESIELEDTAGQKIKGRVRESMGGPGYGYEFQLEFASKTPIKGRKLHLKWAGANQLVPLTF